MKRFILNWLGLNKRLGEMYEKLNDLQNDLNNRRQEIDELAERLQNIDNEEVIKELHLRIKKLEGDK